MTRWRSASASASTSRSPPAHLAREFGAVELLEGGRLRVRTGATPYGQGHETTWAMLVADRTGVPIDQIEVIHGDTDLVRSGGLTVGSRSVQLAGRGDRRRHGQAGRASPPSGPPNGWRRRSTTSCSTTTSGRFHVAGTPARHLGWAELADGPTAEPLAGRGATSGRRCRRSRSAPTSPSWRWTPRPATSGCARSSRSTTPAGS